MIKKIDLSKIRGAWRQRDEYGQDAGGDDTVESLKIIAEKVNELRDAYYQLILILEIKMTCELCKNSTSTYCNNCYPKNPKEVENLKDHVCGGELCIVCGYRKKMGKEYTHPDSLEHAEKSRDAYYQKWQELEEKLKNDLKEIISRIAQAVVEECVPKKQEINPEQDLPNNPFHHQSVGFNSARQEMVDNAKKFGITYPPEEITSNK